MIGPKPEDMYPPTRRAIEDAFWDVLGTVAYGLLLCLVFLVGLQLVVLTLLFGGRDVLAAGLVAVGVVAITGAAYELHRTFDLRQGIRRQRRRTR